MENKNCNIIKQRDVTYHEHNLNTIYNNIIFKTTVNVLIIYQYYEYIINPTVAIHSERNKHIVYEESNSNNLYFREIFAKFHLFYFHKKCLTFSLILSYL